jgi:ABC-2 type transport system permease protein
VVGAGLYLCAVGLLGLGLGAMLRNTAGAIASLFGVLFALQIVVGFLPAPLSDQIYGYLPAPAGIAVTNVRPDRTSLEPWTGLGLFCLYTTVVVALAAWQLRRRDA